MDDLIKRSEAKDAVIKQQGLYGAVVDDICERIEAIPSADRQQGTDFDEWHKLMEIFYNEGVADAWDIAQTVFESTLTLNEAKDVYRQMKGAANDNSFMDYSGSGNYPHDRAEPTVEVDCKRHRGKRQRLCGVYQVAQDR